MHTGEWMLANQWIYEIYTEKDWENCLQELFQKCAKKLKADAGVGFRIDADQAFQILSVFTSGQFPADAHENDLKIFSSLLYSEKSSVLRNGEYTDEEELKKESRPAALWLKKTGLCMLGCCQKQICVLFFFFREGETEEFSHDDKLLLQVLMDHIAWREAEYQKTMKNRPVLSVEQAAMEFHLTRQETKILDLTMQRMSNAEIAQTLSISINTLKKHLLNIYRKCNISSRLQLFRLMKGNS